jgi:hypothetical protein
MGENLGGHRLFIGTYTKGKSRGIYSATLDLATGGAGALGTRVGAAEAPNPTFLALSPDRQFPLRGLRRRRVGVLVPRGLGRNSGSPRSSRGSRGHGPDAVPRLASTRRGAWRSRPTTTWDSRPPSR